MFYILQFGLGLTEPQSVGPVSFLTPILGPHPLDLAHLLGCNVYDLHYVLDPQSWSCLFLWGIICLGFILGPHGLALDLGRAPFLGPPGFGLDAVLGLHDLGLESLLGPQVLCVASFLGLLGFA